MSTALELAARYNTRAALIEREFGATMRGVRTAAERYCKETLIAEVYAIPEDRTKSGKKKWTRTRRLLNAEKAVLSDPFTVEVVNATLYAEPRHEAGKPGRRKINPLRESHWRDELLATFRPLLADLCQQTWAAIFARRGR